MRLALVSLASLLFLTGCPGSSSHEGPGEASITLVGAGATFPYPLYSKWVAEYERTKPSVRVNYQSIGSGGGIRQLAERTVDFGASDAPLADEAIAKLGPVHHVPMTLGAVVATFNVPGVTELKLTPELLVAIFTGEVTSWNDARLGAENPGAKLPALPIVPVHRSDGSGTTYVLTDYLAKASPAWREKIGKGTAVKFPAGIGAKGNEGVTGQVKQTEGSIGYVELVYARANELPVATLRNRAGKFVAPTIDAVSAAAASAELSPDLRVSIVDAPGDAAYPIASFTWIVVYEDQRDAAKGKAIAEFLDWALGPGQAFAPDLGYAPLPERVVTLARGKVRAIKSGGKPLIAAN